ncbi:MAG: DNA polymerase III subunit gamma/tau [Candidatus Cloacimonetes bacterium]|jgi:DNA polymerase-3 subunit gamma/tau|nr:DNA polymerase III subunit gamma/tau [Candidatus Cloacimonadota bacterium]
MEKHFTRKYRPIQLTDVIGQEKVVKALTKQAEKNALSQAFLFAGHWGSGKTTMARIVAKILTCEDVKGAVACGKCRSCTSIHSGYCPDVAEIDAGSTGGIEKARAIKQDAQTAPQELSRKIYILDEAHKLTEAAWNALLKVVEEPPPYVTFIFCTTDHRKVPNTIVSRCRRYQFKGISKTDITKRLKQVSDREQIKTDPTALSYIAEMSQGAMRDAFELLEDVAIVTDNDVTEAQVREYFGVPENRLLYRIAKKVAEGDASGIMMDVDDLIMANSNVRLVATQLAGVFRNAMIFDVCGPDSKLLDIDDSEKEILSFVAKNLKRQGLVKIGQILGRVERDLEANLEERYALEAALISCILIVNNEANKLTPVTK